MKRKSKEETAERIKDLLQFCADLTDPKPKSTEEVWELYVRASHLDVLPSMQIVTKEPM